MYRMLFLNYILKSETSSNLMFISIPSHPSFIVKGKKCCNNSTHFMHVNIYKVRFLNLNVVFCERNCEIGTNKHFKNRSRNLSWTLFDVELRYFDICRASLKLFGFLRTCLPLYSNLGQSTRGPLTAHWKVISITLAQEFRELKSIILKIVKVQKRWDRRFSCHLY